MEGRNRLTTWSSLSLVWSRWATVCPLHKIHALRPEREPSISGCSLQSLTYFTFVYGKKPAAVGGRRDGPYPTMQDTSSGCSDARRAEFRSPCHGLHTYVVGVVEAAVAIGRVDEARAGATRFAGADEGGVGILM
jgi:hypothetical protein